MNINDRVKVVMTDAGLEVFKGFYRDMKSQCDNRPYWDGHIDRIERVLETSLWHLMEIFGPATNMPGPTMFESNEIEILKE